MMDLSALDLDAATLQAGYRARAFTPSDVIGEVYRRIAARGDDGVWLHVQDESAVLERAAALEAGGDLSSPLFGLPYGVKDNLDAAHQPTTAGCEPLRYVPERSAAVVEKLERAGALLLGKQNLDQFATGLVGIRCTGRFCRSAIDARYIPGGSSSGSAVAVAAGLTTFSIGSDTGGSGRVPAAYNGIVGLKPTPGLVSSRGFLHCNRTFDVPSVFARNVDDAYSVLDVLRGYDAEDDFSEHAPVEARRDASRGLRLAIPRASQLEFFGDAVAERAFARVFETLSKLGAELVEVDFAPFLEAGRTVFQSALIAERWVTYGSMIERHPEAVHPVVRSAIANAQRYSASDAFEVLYRLRALTARANETLAPVTCLVTPTVGTLYTVEDVLAEPLERNTHMGYYTYFANPLRLSAISLPAGRRDDGLPFSVCLTARGFHEADLERVALALQQATAFS